MNTSIDNLGRGSRPLLDDIAANCRTWRAIIDGRRDELRGFNQPDPATLLDADRVVAQMERTLRGDQPAVVIPATGASVLANIGAATQAWRSRIQHEKAFDNAALFVPTEETDEASRILDGLDALLRGEDVRAEISATLNSIASDAVSALSDTVKLVYQLAAQFNAVDRAAGDRSTPEEAVDLARLGAYTAADWANGIDLVHEACEARLREVLP